MPAPCVHCESPNAAFFYLDIDSEGDQSSMMLCKSCLPLYKRVPLNDNPFTPDYLSSNMWGSYMLPRYKHNTDLVGNACLWLLINHYEFCETHIDFEHDVLYEDHEERRMTEEEYNDHIVQGKKICKFFKISWPEFKQGNVAFKAMLRIVSDYIKAKNFVLGNE